jgi:hypothetical protein
MTGLAKAGAAGTSATPADSGNAPAIISIAAVRTQQAVAVSGAIRRYRAMSLRGTPACSYTLADGTGEIDLLFLGRLSVAGLCPGRRCGAAGMAAVRDGRYVLWNPQYTLHGDGTFGRGADEAASQRDPEACLPDMMGPSRFNMISTEFDIDRIRCVDNRDGRGG